VQRYKEAYEILKCWINWITMESMAQFNSIDEVYRTKLQDNIDDIYIDQGLEGEI